MENFLGLLRIRIKRGINLAVRDTLSSDPYVIVRMGKQVTFLTPSSSHNLNFSLLMHTCTYHKFDLWSCSTLKKMFSRFRIFSSMLCQIYFYLEFKLLMLGIFE